MRCLYIPPSGSFPSKLVLCSFWLDQSYFDYATGLKMTDNAKWETLFGFPQPSNSEP